MAKRQEWIDAERAIVLVLVVLGHTLREGVARNIVYAFHVPCFFFISGILADHELSVKIICKEVRRTLIPYYTFGIISIAIYGALGSIAATNFGMSTDSIGENLSRLIYGHSSLKFNAPLWFLPALFATRMLYRIIYQIFGGNIVAITCVALTGSVASFLYTKADYIPLPFSFELILKLFPFFIIGKVLSSKLICVAGTPNRKICARVGLGLTLITCILGGIAPP